MKMTRHARVRSQQRGIPPMIVDLLYELGAEVPAGDGCIRRYFDKAAHRRLKSYAGHLAGLLAEHMDAFIVVGEDGSVVTVGPQTKRIHRH